MSPRDALQVMDQVGANFVGNREDHNKIGIALAVLASLVNEKEAADKASASKSTSEEVTTTPSKTSEETQTTEEDETQEPPTS